MATVLDVIIDALYATTTEAPDHEARYQALRPIKLAAHLGAHLGWPEARAQQILIDRLAALVETARTADQGHDPYNHPLQAEADLGHARQWHAQADYEASADRIGATVTSLCGAPVTGAAAFWDMQEWLARVITAAGVEPGRKFA